MAQTRTFSNVLSGILCYPCYSAKDFYLASQSCAQGCGSLCGDANQSNYNTQRALKPISTMPTATDHVLAAASGTTDTEKYKQESAFDWGYCIGNALITIPSVTFGCMKGIFTFPFNCCYQIAGNSELLCTFKSRVEIQNNACFGSESDTNAPVASATATDTIYRNGNQSTLFKPEQKQVVIEVAQPRIANQI